MELEHGFKIQSMPTREAIRTISGLERNLPLGAVQEKLVIDYKCLNSDEQHLFFISHSIETDVQKDVPIRSRRVNKELNNFYKLRTDYLYPVIRKMRLFKEGNIEMPLQYYYYIDNETPRSFMSLGTNRVISRELYNIKKSELPELYKFLIETNLPFKRDYLNLALRNYELSYQMSYDTISFMTIMLSLESLFNRADQHELTYSISRNAAVLLGKNLVDSKTIFNDIKYLYGIRSSIVHKGTSSKLKHEDVLRLRQYIRDSIKIMCNIDMEKDDILDKITSLGFGEGASIT